MLRISRGTCLGLQPEAAGARGIGTMVVAVSAKGVRGRQRERRRWWADRPTRHRCLWLDYPRWVSSNPRGPQPPISNTLSCTFSSSSNSTSLFRHLYLSSSSFLWRFLLPHSYFALSLFLFFASPSPYPNALKLLDPMGIRNFCPFYIFLDVDSLSLTHSASLFLRMYLHPCIHIRLSLSLSLCLCTFFASAWTTWINNVWQIWWISCC